VWEAGQRWRDAVAHGDIARSLWQTDCLTGTELYTISNAPRGRSLSKPMSEIYKPFS